MPVHHRMRAFDRDPIAEGIMASGHANRANSRTHACTDQRCDVTF